MIILLGYGPSTLQCTGTPKNFITEWLHNTMSAVHDLLFEIISNVRDSFPPWCLACRIRHKSRPYKRVRSCPDVLGEGFSVSINERENFFFYCLENLHCPGIPPGIREAVIFEMETTSRMCLEQSFGLGRYVRDKKIWRNRVASIIQEFTCGTVRIFTCSSISLKRRPASRYSDRTINRKASGPLARILLLLNSGYSSVEF